MKVCALHSTIISFHKGAREKVYFIGIHTFELERRKASHVLASTPHHAAVVAVAVACTSLAMLSIVSPTREIGTH